MHFNARTPSRPFSEHVLYNTCVAQSSGSHLQYSYFFFNIPAKRPLTQGWQKGKALAGCFQKAPAGNHWSAEPSKMWHVNCCSTYCALSTVKAAAVPVREQTTCLGPTFFFVSVFKMCGRNLASTICRINWTPGKHKEPNGSCYFYFVFYFFLNIYLNKIDVDITEYLIEHILSVISL